MKSTLALAFLSAALLAGCAKEKPVAEPVRPVLVQQVVPGSAGGRDVYSGELRARHEADLSFRIGGKLVARPVDAGARVKRGQVLARLDPEDARLASQSAQAQLAAAESDFTLAKAELDRYADLLAKKFISQSAFDARQNAFTAARARVEQARAQASLSGNQANYTALSADADGVVLSVSAEPGQVVAAGQPVLRLARDGEKEVVLNAPEGELARFKPGQEARIALWAEPGKVFAGRVREIAGGADPVTRTYAVRVTAVDAPPTAQLGMTANVTFGSATGTAVVLPLSAVMGATLSQGKANTASVWVVDPKSGQVHARKVEVSQFGEHGATITSGLQAGELVVTAGVHKLRENQVVRHVSSL